MQNSLKSVLLVAVTAASLSSAQAAFPVGDGEAFLTGSVGYKSNDNLYLSNTGKKSSGVLVFTPGISVEFGTDALAKNILTFSETFNRYSSASSQDTELANVRYTGSYSDDKSKINVTAGYAQNAQNNRDARLNGIIVKNTIESVKPTLEWTMSPKTAFGIGAEWENNNYKNVGFSDRDSWSVPLDFYYEIAPKLQASAGYRYRADSQTGAPDSTDNYFNLGARGEFDPKLHGTFSVGYDQHKIKSFGTTAKRDESTIGLDAKFDYDFSEKTKLRAGFSNGYVPAATGATQRIAKISGGGTSEVTTELSLDASLEYSTNKYIGTTRTDDLWNLDLGATYKVNKYVSVKGGYTYQNNSSTSSALDFKNSIFAVSASVRY